ncbi:MAG: hypothetical protein EOP04_18985 [Proteobacteria bacterium]|nr:MAG: hypothetical protein EOP04_18985 [Pseudomonadota bacterium]
MISFLTRPTKLKAILKLIGTVLFWIGYAYVVALAFRNSDALFTVITGLPFFFMSIWLFVKTYRQASVSETAFAD